MTTYTNQGPSHSGAAITMAAPSGTASDSCPTGDHFGLLVNNVGSAAITVTLPVSATYDGLAVASRTVSVPGTAAAGTALGGWEIIPMPSSVYGIAPEPVIYSTIANVTVASVRIP